MLLWATVLAGWGFAVATFSTSLPEVFRARVLAVMALVSVGFHLFLLLTSNPFERLLPAPLEGRDLNPLLQDPGMAGHPPLLYMGYVGLVVPFSFAVAALIEGRMDLAWTRWTRPWTTVAWAFLTAGIMLGSWWAYSELGWGGWWFWDPVENASFMPWLVATALIHSLAVTEQRGAFRAWTLLLALSGFSLSLLGAFLVRSGVLVSVHAFATDPARGLFILAFLVLVIGTALVLYAWRAAGIAGGGNFGVCSRETFLLANNVLLVATSGTVLLGTLYPLLLDALDAGKISVGPPYFNSVFVPLMLPLAALLGFAPLARWKRDEWWRLVTKVRIPFLVVVVASVALAFGTPATWAMAAGTGFALWIAAGVVLGVRDRLRHRHGASVRRALGRGFAGMTLAHLGAGVFIAGVTWTTGAGGRARRAARTRREHRGLRLRVPLRRHRPASRPELPRGARHRAGIARRRAVRRAPPREAYLSRSGGADDRGGGRARLHPRPLRGARRAGGHGRRVDDARPVQAAGALDLARAADDGDRRPSRRRGSAVPTRPASCHEPGRGDQTCARLRLGQ